MFSSQYYFSRRVFIFSSSALKNHRTGLSSSSADPHTHRNSAGLGSAGKHPKLGNIPKMRAATIMGKPWFTCWWFMASWLAYPPVIKHHRSLNGGFSSHVFLGEDHRPFLYPVLCGDKPPEVPHIPQSYHHDVRANNLYPGYPGRKILQKFHLTGAKTLDG